MKNKTKAIQDLVNHLQTKFGKTEILIQDYWDADNLAIGLTDKTKQFNVYLSICDQEINKFYVSLENPTADKALPYEPAGEFKNVTLDELEKIISQHLKIQL